MASGISPQRRVPSMTKRQISRVDAVIGRQAVSMLVRWCPIAGLYQDADDSWCNTNYCYEDRITHRLRLRRMLVCSICKMAFFTKKGFEDHECFDRY